MRFSVGIGNRIESFDISNDYVVDVMRACDSQPLVDEDSVISESIAHPIGTPRLVDMVGPNTHVCIMTSDVTRPFPTSRVLPHVIDALHAGGVANENITLAIALGSHRPQTHEELQAIMGEYYGHLRVINGGSEGFTHLGNTTAGTPIEVLSEVLDADLRIGLGNVEYHYFAGYSGGAKALIPGMSSIAAIQQNHSLMVDSEAYAGNVNSPVRRDLEEACAMVGLDFIVNVVLDEEKRIVYCASGDYIKAHRDACAKLDELYGCAIEAPYDIVIASQGGLPKDLNLYQTQKALDNAKLAVCDGGVIILVGSCREGYGQATFERWFMESDTPQEIVQRLEERFVLGGHKAAAMAQVMLRARVYLVSDLADSVVESSFMRPFKSVQAAVDAALQGFDHNARILCMPHAGSTLPLLKEA